MTATLLDSSAIVAWLDRREKLHSKCAEALRHIQPPLVTCDAVIVESCYLLRNIRGANQSILDNIAKGVFQLPFRLSHSSEAVAELLRKYADTPADFADACLIQMANELGTGDILTLDSDFRHYRWRRNRKFNLLIPLN